MADILFRDLIIVQLIVYTGALVVAERSENVWQGPKSFARESKLDLTSGECKTETQD